jgi:hypothetical protein
MRAFKRPPCCAKIAYPSTRFAMPFLARKLLLTAALIGAGSLTKSTLDLAYRKSTGSRPPKNPAAKEVGWADALLWSGLAGLAAGMTRTTVRRVAAKANKDRPVERKRKARKR